MGSSCVDGYTDNYGTVVAKEVVRLWKDLKKGTCLVFGCGKDCKMENGKQGAMDEFFLSSRFGLVSLELERNGDAMGCFFLFEWGKESAWIESTKAKLSHSPVLLNWTFFKFFSSGCAKRAQKDYLVLYSKVSKSPLYDTYMGEKEEILSSFQWN